MGGTPWAHRCRTRYLPIGLADTKSAPASKFLILSQCRPATPDCSSASTQQIRQIHPTNCIPPFPPQTPVQESVSISNSFFPTWLSSALHTVTSPMGSVAAVHLIGQGRKAKVLCCTIPEAGEPDGTHETTPGESISPASVGGTKEGISKHDSSPPP